MLTDSGKLRQLLQSKNDGISTVAIGQAQPLDPIRSRHPRPSLIALLIGLGLGCLFSLWWPGLPSLATLALWPAAIAVALLAVAVGHKRRRGQLLWGLMIWGQLLGLVAIALFFFASLK